MDGLILANARLIDGMGGVAERVTVRVTEERIAEVGPGADVEPGPGVEVIDLAGRTLMPALVDAHIHFSSYQTLPEPLRGEEPRTPALRYFELANHARALVEMGVLTVRDVGSGDDHALHLRQAVRLGLCPGPRILACGRIVSATSPGCRIFTTMYRPADGCDEARKAVREQLMMGADFIKVMTTGARSVVLEDPEPAQLTREEVRTIVEEAHRMGARVAAHVEGLNGASIAVEEGVNTIEYGLSLHASRSCSTEWPRTASSSCRPFPRSTTSRRISPTSTLACWWSRPSASAKKLTRHSPPRKQRVSGSRWASTPTP